MDLTVTGSLPLILIDADIPRQQALAARLRAKGRSLSTPSDTLAALRELGTLPHAALLLSLAPGKTDPIDVICHARRQHPDMPVIALACPETSHRIAPAIRAGAAHCLIHPVTDNALEHALLTSQGRHGARDTVDDGPLAGFDGTSPPMQGVYSRIRAAARTRVPVLISGESGTGKKLCAQVIHLRSTARRGAFLAVDCRGTEEAALEAAINGHLDRHAGGTLFLEDVSALSTAAQLTLTRILNRLEASFAAPELRIVCSMLHTPSPEADPAPSLRPDLLHRLQVLPIAMPPLRERTADILALCEAGLCRFSAEAGRAPAQITACALECLQAHPWPGNVRQLLNLLRALTTLEDSPLLTRETLPDDIRNPPRASPGGQSGFAGQTMAQIERAVLEDTIARHDGSVPRAARELDLAPSTIYRKMTGWRSAE